MAWGFLVWGLTACQPQRPGTESTGRSATQSAIRSKTQPETLTIAAAASLQESLTEIATAFESQTNQTQVNQTQTNQAPNRTAIDQAGIDRTAIDQPITHQATAPRALKVQLTFGASGTLQRQIEQGAPIDVFVSAATEPIEQLATQQRVIKTSPTVFAQNCLVAVVPYGKPPIQALRDLTQRQRIAIGNPATVPAGRYAQESLERAGIFASLQQSQKLVFGESVRQVLAYVEAGNVDAAIVYRTDAAIASHLPAFLLPAAQTPAIRYQAAAIAGQDHPDRAQEFLQFLTSETAQKILLEAGFASASDASPCDESR